MTLIGLLIALIIIGVVFWAVGQIPMAQPVRTVVVVVVALIVVLWLLSSGAGLHGLRIS